MPHRSCTKSNNLFYLLFEQGYAADKYIAGNEHGICPPIVLAKNALGHFEKHDALSSRWVIAFEWLDFLPEDNVRDHRLQYLNQDLVMLLRLKHHLFWSQIVYDKSLSSFINSFLMYARRVGTTRASSLSATEGFFADSAPDMSKLSLSHKSLMRNLFTVVLRIATGKESPSIGFGSAEFHGDLVYQVLDLPRLMDFVSLYSRFNLPVVSTVVNHLFDIQPKYSQEVGKVITAANQVLMESWRQLSRALQSTLSNPTTPPPTAESISSATNSDTNESKPVENDQITGLREVGEDLATYLIDLLYTLSSFVKVRPHVAKQLGDSDFVAALSYTLRAALPNLRLVFEGGAPAPVDIIRRHIATRNHALSLINKIISVIISEIEFIIGEETETISGSAIAHRVALILPLLESLINHLQSLASPDRTLVERVAKNSEDNRPFAWLLIEDDAQQQSHANANIKPGGALNTSTGLARTVVSPEANSIIRLLEEKYELTAVLDELSELLVTKWSGSNEFGPLQQPLAMLNSISNELRSLAEVSSLANSLTMENPTRNRQEELKWQDTVKQSSEVRQIATDLSEGFIAYALLKHYEGNSDRFINDYIEGNLSVQLNGLDRNMSLEAARQKILLASSAALEEAKRFRVSGDGLRSSKGKRDMKRKGKDAMAEYYLATKHTAAEADAMAELTLKFIAAQERADEERSYNTQIRRARGEEIDEEDEDLYEELKASAEFYERAAERSAAMTYEDEPDDSLDDFHPVGAMADADRDSSLVGRRGPIRSKFASNPGLLRVNAPVEEEEEEEEADYAGDYGQVTESSRSSVPSSRGGQPQQSHQSHHGQHGKHSGGQKQQQQGGRGQGGQGKKGNQSEGQQQSHQQNKGQNQQQQGGRGQGGQQGGQGGKKGGAAPSSSTSTASVSNPSHAKTAPQAAPQSAGRGAPRASNASQPKQSSGRGKPSNRGKN